MATIRKNVFLLTLYNQVNIHEWFLQVLMSLKALSNIGVAGDSIQVINRCLKQDSNPIEIRLAAMDALKGMPCTYKVWTFNAMK